MQGADLWQVHGEASINKRGAARVLRGHPWVYRSDVVSVSTERAGLVQVLSGRGKPLGVAMHNPRSEIRLRMLSRADEVTPEGVRARLQAALSARRSLMGEATAFRWVHGEADGLPGIFIDRYGDAVSLQTTCEAADQWESALVEMVVDILAPRVVVIRDDTQTRRRENLPRRVELVVGEEPARAVYHEGDVALEIDLLADQKTGSYLDQTANHVEASRFAGRRALDCCTYHGGFALQLARAGADVTALDQSRAALERAQANAERNGLQVRWVEADVFEHLGELTRRNERFDCVVVDPPAFASGRESVAAARRAYIEVNQRALSLLEPGGILITCSCSGRVDSTMFDDIVSEAVARSGKSVHLVQRRGAGPDHPVLVGMPETEYLKCRILRVA